MKNYCKKAIVIGATSGKKGFVNFLFHNNYKVGITGRKNILHNEFKQKNPNSFFIKTFDIM